MSASTLSISWRTIAATATLVGIATLTTLAIVVSTNATDVLTVVALAIAIISFIGQFAVASTQIALSTRDASESMKLNLDSHAVLSDVRSAVKSISDVQSAQFDRVLNAALNTSSKEGGSSVEEISSEIARSPVRLPSRPTFEWTPTASPSLLTQAVLTTGLAEAPLRKRLAEWIDDPDEALALCEVAETYPFRAIGWLIAKANYEAAAEINGRPKARWHTIPPGAMVRFSLENDLAEIVENPYPARTDAAGDDKVYTVLTRKGRIVAGIAYGTSEALPPAIQARFQQ